MNAIEWLGALAGLCTTVSFAPQVIKVYRTRNVADISLAMYVTFVIGVALWLVYGVMIRSFPVAITNAITLVLAGSVLVMKIRFGRQAAQRPPAAGRTLR
jgi:MtN3 and saliva related transmembrane protein